MNKTKCLVVERPALQPPKNNRQSVHNMSHPPNISPRTPPRTASRVHHYLLLLAACAADDSEKPGKKTITTKVVLHWNPHTQAQKQEYRAGDCAARPPGASCCCFRRTSMRMSLTTLPNASTNGHTTHKPRSAQLITAITIQLHGGKAKRTWRGAARMTSSQRRIISAASAAKDSVRSRRNI